MYLHGATNQEDDNLLNIKIMKKILYTLFTVLVMVSCNQDEMDIPAPLKQESGERVKLTFNVRIPEAQKVESRTFSETATLTSLWLVLFDEQGYYVGKAQAKNASATALLSMVSIRIPKLLSM